MELLFVILLIISALDFLFLISLLYYGISRLRIPQKTLTNPKEKVSIIICGRNEDKNIPSLAKSLEKLDYPKDLFEVILVNDASTDNTLDLMQEYALRNNNWRVIDIKEKSKNLKGKKYALTRGIESAENNIILVTDADCIVQENWIRRIVESYKDNTGVVIGFSPSVVDDTFSGKMKKFINLCNAIISAGSAGCGHPYSCVGRNLSFRKDLFEQVGGFSSVGKYSSGDDILILMLITGNTEFKAECCTLDDSLVYTKPVDENTAYLKQQRRRMGKTFFYTVKFIVHSSILLLYFLTLTVIVFFLPEFRLLASATFLLLTMAQIALFINGAYLFGQQELIKSIPIMIILYPLHTLFFSIWGNISRGRWKQ